MREAGASQDLGLGSPDHLQALISRSVSFCAARMSEELWDDWSVAEALLPAYVHSSGLKSRAQPRPAVAHRPCAEATQQSIRMDGPWGWLWTD